MARTNKMGILKKKMQQQKQKKVMNVGEWVVENVKKEYENPVWRIFLRFFRSWKYVCDQTTAREDPDWYRIIRKPNSGEIFFEFKGEASYAFRAWKKKLKMNIKSK